MHCPYEKQLHTCMINVEPMNEEVLYATDPIVRVGSRDIGELIERAIANPRKRIRICSHKDVRDPLHEMLIVHTNETYVRPHKHLGKSESSHIIQGEVDVVVFDDDGGIADVLQLGDYASGKTFYYRIAGPFYHTLLIRSEVIVFHETTNGPFDLADTVFAPWEPDYTDAAALSGYIMNLRRKASAFLFANQKSRDSSKL